MKTGAWMDRAQPYDKIILNEDTQNKHGSLCSIMDTWHKNNSRQRLSQNPEILKSAISRELLCMLVLVTTKITKIHGIHPCEDGMAFYKTHVELRIIACTH